MKKFNGTDYDGLLPLAYNALNSQQLDGESLSEVKQWVQDNGLLLYTGQYVGTGMYGQSNPNSITFPFEPILLLGGPFAGIIDRESGSMLGGSVAILTSISNTGYDGLLGSIYVKMSEDRKTISWYYGGSTNPAQGQNNSNSTIYLYTAIGGYDMGGQTEWTITQSGTWTVPKTGRYYIELYGGGGGGALGSTSSDMNPYGASGGSSCQSYDSVTLTKGDAIVATIGVGGAAGKGSGDWRGGNGTSTTFGSYTVDGAGGSSPYFSGGAGAGAGNLGTSGVVGGTAPINPSNGTFGSTYGYGGSGARGSDSPSAGGHGAVYLKYLGA